MAVIAMQKSAGLAATELTHAAASGGGDKFDNDGQTLLHVVVGGTPTNLTVTGNSCSHGFASTKVLSLLANKEYLLGPFDVALYNDANRQVNLSYSSVTAVTVAVTKANNA